ncbi:MAG: SDR family NAD(P)-dependent oxidoreductase [Gammaproteobacteria bacterium]|nr:SDR family NAD(P)-dependent oxidoreductase [Gammaproteobacteria bacterium]
MNLDADKKYNLIIGASSAIAQALVAKLIEKNEYIIGITRNKESLIKHDNIQYLESDYTEAAVNDSVSKLEPIRGNVERVIICNGILHDEHTFPEKAAKEFTMEQYQHVVMANSAIPMLWLSRLLPIMKGDDTCHVVVFSARIGSIGDNKLGGWYSYRASKAALNMLLKSLAVECARSVKNVKLISFHPGTTDTPLSKPFQKRVPEDKLFEPKFVAQQILDYLSTSEPDGQLDFVDWEHKKVAW